MQVQDREEETPSVFSEQTFIFISTNLAAFRPSCDQDSELAVLPSPLFQPVSSLTFQDKTKVVREAVRVNKIK